MRRGLVNRALTRVRMAACLTFLSGEIYGRVLNLEYGKGMRESVREVRNKQKDFMDLQSFEEPGVTFNPIFGIFGSKSFPRGSYSHFFDVIWVNRDDIDKTGVISHEAGHEYHSKIAKNLGLRNNHYRNVISSFTTTRNLVSEGIAEYFETAFKSGVKIPVMSSERLEMRSFEEYGKKFGHPVGYYEGGFRLVKPF